MPTACRILQPPRPSSRNRRRLATWRRRWSPVRSLGCIRSRSAGRRRAPACRRCANGPCTEEEPTDLVGQSTHGWRMPAPQQWNPSTSPPTYLGLCSSLLARGHDAVVYKCTNPFRYTVSADMNLPAWMLTSLELFNAWLGTQSSADSRGAPHTRRAWCVGTSHCSAVSTQKRVCR